ncbi:DUF6234 family protein [Streptomyces sp. NPDC004646]
MYGVLTVSPPRRRRPWSRATPTFADVSVALLLSRAPWTVASQVIVALAVGALLAQVQRDYDRSHPVPAPTPTTRHVPCYSGSGTCE